ncbi:hypothetical protein CFC21_038478 [Triticum aestivum]|uniref:Uncharacterized protein n=2 Tax=Triticum aestivum TaxID=4565 RepID=A0A9R1JR57_WHEAT|nr:uncharacterized protein LOC123063604 [Triticum aestivum]KAF7026363.1 hypothetical protein CFC21_038477 [Triticum aestivum]KAF7026364.1 hypothetical protein CFC21_038478 [Triticum aestivum]
MKREGFQHGAVRVNRNKLLRVAGGTGGDAAAAALDLAGVAYARAPSKPTNASRDTGRCRRPRCAGCHVHPAAKARDKAKGAHKLRASDVALNHRLVSWRLVDGDASAAAARTGGVPDYKGASASAVLAYLAGGNSWHAEDEDDDDEDQDGADLQAPPRGISDLYDLIVGLQAGAAAPAPGGPEDDADGTAAVTPSDEIEEQDAEITDDVDEEDDGFCMVHGITIALEFSGGEEDWIVV